MCSRISLALAACALLACVFPARADQIDLPAVQMESGTYRVDMPVYGGGHYYYIGYEDPVTGENIPYEYENAEFRVVASGFLDADPMVSYGITVTDLGAPSTFSFTFAMPIVATGPISVVTGSIVGGLTDFTGNGVSITPNVPDMDGDGIPEMQVNSLTAPLTSMGVDVGPAVNFGPGGLGAVHSYGPFAAGPQAGPAGVWTGLQIDLDFGLSGGGDIAVLTGIATIEQIPEPSTIALLAVGGVLLAGRRLLRRRSFS